MAHPAKGKKRPDFNKDGSPRKKTRSPNKRLPETHRYIERIVAANYLGMSVQELDPMIGVEFTRIPFGKRRVLLIRDEVYRYRDNRDKRAIEQRLANQQAAGAEVRRKQAYR